MNTAAPDPSAPSDAAIAQAHREFGCRSMSSEPKTSTGAWEWIRNRARDIDAIGRTGDLGAQPVVADSAVLAQSKGQRDWFTQFAMPIGELVNCLPSADPSGNDHIIRAIKEATPAAPVGGFVVVPRELTEAMRKAFYEHRVSDCMFYGDPVEDDLTRWANDAYAAMIAASPAAQPSAKDGVRVEVTPLMKCICTREGQGCTNRCDRIGGTGIRREDVPTLATLIADALSAEGYSTEGKKVEFQQDVEAATINALSGLHHYVSEATTASGLVDEAKWDERAKREREGVSIEQREDYFHIAQARIECFALDLLGDAA